MTTADHPATGQLALLALCGDLVVAIEAMSIHAIRQVAETTARSVGDGLAVIELDGARVPGWDLCELLGLGAGNHAWVVVDLPGLRGRVGFRVGRCVMVHPLPSCRTIPRGIFTARGDAVAAGFSVAAIPELAEHVSGVVLDLARLLTERERGLTARIGEEGHAPALDR